MRVQGGDPDKSLGADGWGFAVSLFRRVLNETLTVLQRIEPGRSGPQHSAFEAAAGRMLEVLPTATGKAFSDAYCRATLQARLEHARKTGLARCSEPSCNAVETLSVQFQRCSKCQVTAYCCREHQKAHWKAHKPWCQAIARGLNHTGAAVQPESNATTEAAEDEMIANLRNQAMVAGVARATPIFEIFTIIYCCVPHQYF